MKVLIPNRICLYNKTIQEVKLEEMMDKIMQ